MALTKRDEAKVGTYDFHAPKPADLFDERQIGVITIFQYGLNNIGTDLKRIGTPYKISFERAQTEQAVKVAKKTVKALNEGRPWEHSSSVFRLSNGRPRGRQRVAA
jgi:hypothetical protein